MTVIAPAPDRHDIAAWILTAIVLGLALVAHLAEPRHGGLLGYELVHVLARRLRVVRLRDYRAKLVAVGVLSAIIIALVIAAILGLIAFFRSDAGSLPGLMKKMAEIIEGSRPHLPDWLLSSLPPNTDALRVSVVSWLREHATEVQTMGKEVGRTAVRIIIGMIIGAMIALHEAAPDNRARPLARALTERARRLADAFRRIVFAQSRIAAINALFTGIYLVVLLPLLGVHLPLAKTMILITFITGLIPVIGNLISNTVIVVISLSHSLPVATGSFAFLIVIHKLEYFLNARIVGGQISARPWELLLAMFVMEALFGVSGIALAPIYYAYVKDELVSRELV